MLYYLFEYLQTIYNFPGAGLFQYISFRAALAIITSLLVSLVFGGHIIKLIKKKQIIDEEICEKIDAAGVKSIKVHSVITCISQNVTFWTKFSQI